MRGGGDGDSAAEQTLVFRLDAAFVRAWREQRRSRAFRAWTVGLLWGDLGLGVVLVCWGLGNQRICSLPARRRSGQNRRSALASPNGSDLTQLEVLDDLLALVGLEN